MIRHLQEIRADGKVIDETMDFDAMSALGWAPCRVTALRWEHDGRPVDLHYESGVTVRRLRGGRFLAALVLSADDASGPRLCVLDADGREHLDLPNTLNLAGRDEPGAYRWFEDAPAGGGNLFRVVFELARNQAQFAIDVDAESGQVQRTLQMS